MAKLMFMSPITAPQEVEITGWGHVVCYTDESMGVQLPYFISNRAEMVKMVMTKEEALTLAALLVNRVAQKL